MVTMTVLEREKIADREACRQGVCDYKPDAQLGIG